MSANRIKLIRHMIESTGLEFVEYVSNSKNNLIQARARAENGETRLFGITQREGDPRGDQNELSRMRRFYRECTPHDTQLARKLKEKLPELKFVKGVSEPVKPEALSSLPRDPEPEQDPYLEGIMNRDKPAASTPAPAPADNVSNVYLEPTMTATPTPPAKKTIVVTPKKPAKPTKATTSAKLTMGQFYKLVEWMKATDIEAMDSWWSVHNAAAAAIEVKGIPRATMSEAAELAGRKFPNPVKRAATGVFASNVDQIIADEFKLLAKSLGYQLSDKFLKVFGDQ